MRPRENERDAILGLVASWGDRKAPRAPFSQMKMRCQRAGANLLVGSELKYLLHSWIFDGEELRCTERAFWLQRCCQLSCRSHPAMRNRASLALRSSTFSI